MDLTATILENDTVRMEPFDLAVHEAGLSEAADDETIWTYLPFDRQNGQFGPYARWLDGERQAGRWIPFVVFLKGMTGDVVVGSSCYLNIVPHDLKVEIGGTWYNPSVQGTKVNPSCKLLLLTHAFASGANRVEFKTDARNAKSRGALRKLGATEEGVLRHHMKLPDGTFRDSAYFSVLREEWPRVEIGLAERLTN